MTGVGPAKRFLATLTTTAIPISCMVGQGYDEAAAMSENAGAETYLENVSDRNACALHLTLFKSSFDKGRPGDRHKKNSYSDA